MAESSINNAPDRIDIVFPIFLITKRVGNCKRIEKSCDREARETISAGVNLLTSDKNRVSIAI